MSKIKLILILTFLFTGCASTPKIEIHRIEKLTIVYGDGSLIKAACRHDRAKGCYNPVTKTIYCQKNDPLTLAHEMRHVLEGEFHE